MQHTSPAIDSVPVLITQLCVAHLNKNVQIQSNPTASCFHLLRQKHLKKRHVKIKAFETIFNYLKEHKPRKAQGVNTDLNTIDRIHSRVFHLRCQRRFEDASKLEKLLSSLCIDGPTDSTLAVLDFLLGLEDTGLSSDNTLVFGQAKPFLHIANTGRLLDDVLLPPGPLCYGDTRIDLSTARHFMHYPREVFETLHCENFDKAHNVLPLLKMFVMTPGSHLSYGSGFSEMASSSKAFITNTEHSLFGALLHSKVADVNVKLDIPDLDDTQLICIPQFSSRERIETSEDEGFCDAMTSSVESSFRTSLMEESSDDFWSRALHCQLNDHYIWEKLGRVAADTEKPYMTEAGSCAFDYMRSVYRANRLHMVDKSSTFEHLITMKELVNDVIQLLLAIPSKSFLWQQDRFIVSQGLCVRGVSSESLREMCTSLLMCATHFHRLCEFSRVRLPRSTDNYGLLLEAFRRGIRQYLHHYQACILSVLGADLTVLSITCVLRKLMSQIQFLVELCCLNNVNEEVGKPSLPDGFHLLSYLYEECMSASSSVHYPVLLFLLSYTMEPYLCMVSDWSFRGITRDLYGEFMLQVNHEYLCRRDEYYWSQSYVPVDGNIHNSVPVFLKDLAAQIFVCGKTLNLLKLCSKSEHFLIAEDQLEVPPLKLFFGNSSSSRDSKNKFSDYFSSMRSIARQKMQTRSDVKAELEKAKQELQAQVRRSASARLHKLQDDVVKMRTKEDTRKRKLFTELKQQMEENINQKLVEKQTSLQADKKYIESIQKHELLEATHDTQLVQKARDELIAQYAELNKVAELREKKAQWRVRRHQLDTQRVDFLRFASDNWLSTKDDLMVEPPSSFPDQSVDLDYSLRGAVASGSLPNLSLGIGVVETACVWTDVETDGGSNFQADSSSELLNIETGNDETVRKARSSASKWVKDQSGSANDTSSSLVHGSLPKWAATAIMHQDSSFQKTGNMTDDDSCQRDDLSLSIESGNVNESSPVRKSASFHTESVTHHYATRETNEQQDIRHVKLVTGKHVSQTSHEVGSSEVERNENNDSESVAAKDSINTSTKILNNIVINTETDSSNEMNSAVADGTDSVAISASYVENTSDVSDHIASCIDPIDGISGSDGFGHEADMSHTHVKIVGNDRITDESREIDSKNNHVSMVGGNRISDESRETDSIVSHRKMVGDNRINDESKWKPERSHIRTNTEINSLTETAQSTSKISIKSASGRNISAETGSDDTIDRTCIKLSNERNATKESATSSVQQDNYGIPRLKRTQQTYLGKEISWADFSCYQVRRSAASCRRDRMQKESVDEIRSVTTLPQDDDFEERTHSYSGIRLSKSMTSVTESKYVDHDAVRRHRFIWQNIHGHMSDSSIQRLLYGVAQPSVNNNSEDIEIDESTLLPAVEKSPWLDQRVEPYQDTYTCFDKLPVTDLMAWKQHQKDLGIKDVDEQGVNDLDLEMYKATPLPVILERCIMEPLRLQSKLVNEVIVNYFLVDLNISAHFATLYHYLLLQDGEFAQSLTDQLFDKLSNHRRPSDFLNPMYLNGLLHKAVASSIHGDNKLVANISFVIKSRPKSSLKTAPDALDCLELGYKVTWPINLVITENVVSKYSRIFSFMLKLKRAVWVLKSIFHRLKRDAMQTRGRCQQMHALQLYRHEMQHFAKVLHEYIASQVITILRHEFELSLEGTINGIDGLREIHTNYINNSLSRCLLTRNAAPVCNIINSMFSLILTFNSQLTSESWQLDSKSNQLRHPAFDFLHRTFTSFHEHSVFLFKVVDQLASRGYQPHFDELLLRLNYNGFYKSDNYY